MASVIYLRARERRIRPFALLRHFLFPVGSVNPLSQRFKIDMNLFDNSQVNLMHVFLLEVCLHVMPREFGAATGAIDGIYT